MNIESQNVSLMQAVHQAARAPQVSAPAQSEPAQAAAPEAVPAVAPTQAPAKDAQENRRRMAIAEKMIGANKSLIIEKDTHRVGFVYKTVDKQTGEVVRVWPQREVASALLALADSDARAIMAGMLVDAKA
jgi:uncharacterized FlaG/YvyC family protein